MTTDEQRMQGIIAYDLGFRSRDAEVQALRSALEDIARIAGAALTDGEGDE